METTRGEAPPLSVRGVRKAYRRGVVLGGVSFDLAPGQAMALLGSNGAGKSTLIGCVTGDRLPDRGEVRIGGADPFADPTATAAALGYVPEQPFLYPELTVAEMLRFVAAARGIDADAAWDEARRLLEMLGLGGAEGMLCRELSQGMGRKTAIAAALLHGPRAIVLDEALNGLDRPSAARLIAELDERRARGAAVLLSSHDLDFVAEWCGAGLLLSEGARWRLLEGDAWERWRRAPSLRIEDMPSDPAPLPQNNNAWTLTVEQVLPIRGTTFVFVRADDATGDFRVTESSRLNGCPVRPWLEQPLALNADGSVRFDLFALALRSPEDGARFIPGDRVTLES